MNRKLIISAAAVTVLSLWGFLACNVKQPNEGCALENGSNYYAKYTLTNQTGNCALFQTFDPNGNTLVDSNGNWLSGEQITVNEFGPNGGPITIQFLPQSLSQDTPDGGFCVGTLGNIQLTNGEPTTCNIPTMTAQSQIVGDPNFGLPTPSGSKRAHPPEDPASPDAGTANTSSTASAGSNSAGSTGTQSASSMGSNGGSTGSTGSSGAAAGSSGGSAGGSSGAVASAGSSGASGSVGASGSTGTVAAGSMGGSTGGKTSGSMGGSASGAASNASGSTSGTTGGPSAPPVVVTYTFTNIAFQEEYSILGKQFNATLNYTQVPLDASLGGTSCTATIDVEAVQYHDFAVGQPGHISGDHCEQDTNGDQTDCTAHAATFGFPVSTGWLCQPFGNQNFLDLLITNSLQAPETYADGGTTLPDGGLIPVQRCVPATPVPVGGNND